jgi:hypothetical protein
MMGGIMLPQDASRMPPLRALNNKTNKKYHNGRHHAQDAWNMLPLQVLSDK